MLTHSLVLLSEISFSRLLRLLLFCFFSALNNFSKGIVEPPNTKVVNKTIMSVVVTMTYLVSLKSKWRDRAYEIAPRSPLNHIMNIIFFVILCSRNLFTRKARGKMLAALPIRHNIKDQTTRAGSTWKKDVKLQWFSKNYFFHHLLCVGSWITPIQGKRRRRFLL